MRLRRLEGQIRGLQRMLEEGQDCKAVVTQLAAAKAALDRVGYRLVAAGMRHCANLDDDPAAAADDTGLSVEELEKLFLRLS
ncbi:MAG: metal-sensitive transcriptional regulator [Acidimicrobiia bacterium]|nr:metal-sensitive transcriptional regulator [Acidimicrobiia bacterium]